MQSFCKEITDFFYGEDTQIDPQPTNLIISQLAIKYIKSSHYQLNLVELFYHDFCQVCLPLMVAQSNSDHRFTQNATALGDTIHKVIVNEILDEMTWNEIKTEINNAI